VSGGNSRHHVPYRQDLYPDGKNSAMKVCQVKRPDTTELSVAATGSSTEIKCRRMVAEGERPTPSAQQDSGQDDVGYKTNLHWRRINE
jgi:hypothetical protein